MGKAAMKRAAVKPGMSLSKSAIAEMLAEKCELKRGQCMKLLAALSEVGAEGPKGGKFTVPGLVRIQLRKKAATKECQKLMFGEIKVVKAKPAKTLVKAYAVGGLKKLF